MQHNTEFQALSAEVSRLVANINRVLAIGADKDFLWEVKARAQEAQRIVFLRDTRRFPQAASIVNELAEYL